MGTRQFFLFVLSGLIRSWIAIELGRVLAGRDQDDLIFSPLQTGLRRHLGRKTVDAIDLQIVESPSYSFFPKRRRFSDQEYGPAGGILYPITLALKPNFMTG
jgi:hypothetical protein